MFPIITENNNKQWQWGKITIKIHILILPQSLTIPHNIQLISLVELWPRTHIKINLWWWDHLIFIVKYNSPISYRDYPWLLSLIYLNLKKSCLKCIKKSIMIKKVIIKNIRGIQGKEKDLHITKEIDRGMREDMSQDTVVRRIETVMERKMKNENQVLLLLHQNGCVRIVNFWILNGGISAWSVQMVRLPRVFLKALRTGNVPNAKTWIMPGEWSVIAAIYLGTVTTKIPIDEFPPFSQSHFIIISIFIVVSPLLVV